MSGIRGKNTKPEMVIRRALHAQGFRYVLHDKRLPGKPDLVFPKYRAVIFVHGCFWHGHNCHLFKWPKTRKNFWEKKIARNRIIDQSSEERLKHAGWRNCQIWECALKGKARLPETTIIVQCERWLRSNKAHLEIRGYPSHD